MPNEQGGHYWLEIMIPGSIVGLIVGYATQKFGRAEDRLVPEPVRSQPGSPSFFAGLSPSTRHINS